MLFDQFVSIADPSDGGSFTAEIKTFNMPGSQVFERLPLDGWTPASATDAQLNYFDVPANPTDAEGLAQWENEWVDHYSGFADATPCLDKTNVRALTNTPNWSGVLTEEGSITETYGSTNFLASSACGGSTDSFTNWVGIGGYGVDNLIQNGFWTSPGLGSFPYYEVLGPSGYGINVTPESLYPSPSLGDAFNIAVNYEDGTAVFGWHDLTNGAESALYDSYEDGHAMSFYYNGATGEAVDERGTVGDDYSTLRDFGSDAWTNVQAKQGSGSLVLIRNTSPLIGMNIYDNSTY